MKKILIVEDDRLVASIYSNKFSNEGFQTAVAADGDSAMQTFTLMKPDAVLLDLGLPKTNGLEVLKWIRQHPELGRVPVVVFTNAYSSHMLQAAWTEGANSCLVKSSSTPRQVSEAVHQALAAAQPPALIPGPNLPPDVPATPAPAAKEADDAAMIAELRQSFLKDADRTIADLRAHAQALVRATDDPARLGKLMELYRRVHSINSNAAIVGCERVARFAAALELLLREMHDDLRNVNPSTLRTLAQSVDFLAALFPNAASSAGAVLAANTLAVDDELISRRAVSYALEKVGLKCVSLQDPATALQMIAENSFDLIILDIDMPGTNGFAVCREARLSVRNARTPVIYVSSLTDWESRVASITSGGEDLIAKPFLFIELGLKALLHLLRGEIQRAQSAR